MARLRNKLAEWGLDLVGLLHEDRDEQVCTAACGIRSLTQSCR
jgi:hypothetical protein